MLASLSMGASSDRDLRSAQREALARVDWRNLRPRLERFARSREASPARAADAVQMAIEQLLAPSCLWDPVVEPDLARHLMRAIRQAIHNMRRSAQNRHEETSDAVDEAPDPKAGALAEAHEREARVADTFARARAALADDADALAVLDLMVEGVAKPAAQAARLNIPVGRVYDAADRIGRTVRRIAREQAAKWAEEVAE
jgi:DNA-directed RNA polymerase specialized sigma24 family protein